jgi:hypothetical protein
MNSAVQPWGSPLKREIDASGRLRSIANAKVTLGLLVMVFLQGALAGCPPRKPTPIVQEIHPI